jgi:hypothetical protein
MENNEPPWTYNVQTCEICVRLPTHNTLIVSGLNIENTSSFYGAECLVYGSLRGDIGYILKVSDFLK